MIIETLLLISMLAGPSTAAFPEPVSPPAPAEVVAGDPAVDLAAAAKSPETLIRALYGMCSFDAGPEPDWERFREVFLEDALIVFSPRGERPMRPLSIDGFIQDWRDFWRDSELEDRGFYETIAALEITEFGGLAHAFVVFEPRIGKEPPTRQIRGLDSIELAFDGERWWVAAITTDFEAPGQTIPPGIGGD